MKKSIRNLFVLVLMFVLCFSFTSCKKEKSLIEKVRDNEMINVAIVQYVSAPPLDSAREGIIEMLNEHGFVHGKNARFIIFNCNGEMSTVSQSVATAILHADLIFAIATPVAQVIKQQFDKTGVEIPTFFTAVTDPVDSEILDNEASPSGSITGTSDLNQVAKQIELLKELNPNAKRVGFIYSTAENNSVIQLDLARRACLEAGFELVSQSVTSSVEFKTVTESLINKNVDAIYLPTDNSLAANAKTVINLANLHHIPTIAGESAFLESGASICYGSVDYKELGKMTADMAVSFMKDGLSISELSVKHFTSDQIDINKTACDEAGINIPESLLSRANIK